MTAGNFDADARAAADAGEYETAIEIYQSALKLGNSKSTLVKNEKVVWNQWGLSLLEQQNYEGALSVFEKALDSTRRVTFWKPKAPLQRNENGSRIILKLVSYRDIT